jgi:ribosomal protein S18 acetylase RimI-like enzyme
MVPILPAYDAMMPVTAAEVRRAEPRDDAAIAPLLYSTAEGRYDLFAGGRERALRLLAASIATPGNDTSRDGILVAEVDGELAGAMAAFPAGEMTARRRRLVRMALGRRAPWRWLRVLRIARMGERLGPGLPGDALYVDALATDRRFRRRGVAAALLGAAEERARALGLSKLTLDTAQANAPANALYGRAGFRVREVVPAGPVIPAVVFYERDVA